MPTALGNNIRESRKRKGYTIRKLARLSGVSASNIWALENRSLRKPSTTYIERIAVALDVAVDDLTGDVRNGALDGQRHSLSASLGGRIRELRQGKGYSLRKLAQLSGVSASNIWDLEKKSLRCPSATYVARIAAALDTAVDDLMGDRTNRAPETPQDSLPVSLGRRIRELRKRKGYTLDKLAKLTDMSESQIWHIENKVKRLPSTEKMARLALALGVSVSGLMQQPTVKANELELID